MEVRLDRRAVAVQVQEQSEEAAEDEDAAEEHEPAELEPVGAHDAEVHEAAVPDEEPAPSARS
jgi:hypothetical protein